jgi:hypothetical protein
MGKQYKQAEDTDAKVDPEVNRLAAFSSKEDDELEEGTSTYLKFANVNDKFDGLFKGIESRNLDQNNPDKMSECAILMNAKGEKFIAAQAIIVKELKKKWDDLKEVGFPCRIIYKGTVGTGADQYQS